MDPDRSNPGLALSFAACRRLWGEGTLLLAASVRQKWSPTALGPSRRSVCVPLSFGWVFDCGLLRGGCTTFVPKA